MQKESSEKELAIASVLCQTWSGVYEPEKALAAGTIFPELNKPFYAAGVLEEKAGGLSQDGISDKKSGLLQKIDETSFVVDDLTLYLDTHETDGEALALFGEMINRRKALLQEFAENYYPLTRLCMATEGGEGVKFRWTDGPVPWEGVCD